MFGLSSDAGRIVPTEIGVVTEITEGVLSQAPMTLNDFAPMSMYMSRCTEHRMLNDWNHAEVCDRV